MAYERRKQMLPKGSKIEAPHVRATGKNGTIHAVERSAVGDGTVHMVAKSLCGKVTVAADKPFRRFQQGLGKECSTCTGKVVEARLAAIKARKALRSKKNQPGGVASDVNTISETVVEKPVKTTANAKPKAAAKKAPTKKVSATAVKKSAPAKTAPPKKTVAKKAPVKKSAARKPAAAKV